MPLNLLGTKIEKIYLQHYLFSYMRLFMSLVLWAILFVLCWPVALFLLILYPLVWLIVLPFRLLGFGITLSLSLVAALFMLPFTLLK